MEQSHDHNTILAANQNVAMRTEPLNITELFLSGADIHEHLGKIAQLRLTIFKEFPYLYDGRLKDELAYLQHYADTTEAAAIILFCNNRLAGAVTAIPLQYESKEMTTPFAATSCPVERTCYIGELLLYPAYRNKGLGFRLLSRIEQHIRAQNVYDYLACATLKRPDDHPLCPEGYVPIERFLHRTQFEILSGVTTHFSWREIDGISRDHEMQFWVKALV